MKKRANLRWTAWVLAIILVFQSGSYAQAANWPVKGVAARQSGQLSAKAAEPLSREVRAASKGKQEGYQGVISLFLVQPGDGDSSGPSTGTTSIEAAYRGEDLVQGASIVKDKVEVNLIKKDTSGNTVSTRLPSGQFMISPKKVEAIGSNTITATYSEGENTYTATFEVTGIKGTVDVEFDYGEGHAIVGGQEAKTVIQQVPIGKTIAKTSIPDPVYEGHQFLGWYSEENGSGSKWSENVVFREDAKYYAYWEKIDLLSIQASYVGNYVTVGQKVDKKDIKVTGNYNYGDPVRLKEEQFEIDNDTITEVGENERLITAVENERITTKIQVVGVARKYTVQFDSQGGDPVISKSVPEGSSIALLPTPKKAGYYLEGWYDEDGNKITPTTPVTKDITYYAKWEEVKIVGLKADYDGTAVAGGKLDKEKLTVWAVKNDGTTERIKDGYTIADYTIREGNNTIKVTYQGQEAEFTVKGYIDNVTVTFDSMGGSAVNKMTVVRGSTITPPKTTYSGFVFSGWFPESGGKGTKLTNTVKITQDTTYYAHWVARAATSITASYSGSSSAGALDVTKVTVTLHYNDGTTETLKSGFSMDKTTLVAGSNTIKVTYNALSTTFYVYVSHGTLSEITASYKGSPVKVGDTIKYTDIAVTAVYSDHSTSIIPSGYTVTGGTIKEGDNLYTISYGGKKVTINIPCVIKYVVSFNSMGGSSIKSVEVTKGQNLGQLVTSSAYTPKYSGYSFADWYLDKEYAKKATENTVVTSNITLYAKWNKYNPYEISDTAMNLKKNEQGVLTILNLPDSKVIWSSSNDYVAEVNSHGVVTAMEKGTSIIRADTSDGYRLSCVVTVGREVSYITTNFTKKTIKKGKSVQLRVKVKPSNAVTKKVKYSSSNKKVATVSSKGKIKGKGKGSCTIYVKTTDSSQIVKKIKIKVK